MQELNPSKLGTLKYWDDFYSKEIQNFQHHGDTGEIWFGEESAEKMVDWIQTYQTSSQSPRLRICEIGCGNGHLLALLNREGYQNLVGLDYSETAIQLAKQISLEQKTNIEFKAIDILNDFHLEPYLLQFDLVLDKGTFDAISLAKEATSHPANVYVSSVSRILSPNGILLITSCNWTESELVERFAPHFNFYSKIKYPSFSFGGMTGQKITTIAFKKM